LINALIGFKGNRRRNSLQLFIKNGINIPSNGLIIISSFIFLLLVLIELLNL